MIKNRLIRWSIFFVHGKKMPEESAKKWTEKLCPFVLRNTNITRVFISFYFVVGAAVAGAEAEESADFLCFLCFLWFLVVDVELADAEASAAGAAAGVVEAAGVVAKAETANRLVTNTQIKVFIFDPIKFKLR